LPHDQGVTAPEPGTRDRIDSRALQGDLRAGPAHATGHPGCSLPAGAHLVGRDQETRMTTSSEPDRLRRRLLLAGAALPAACVAPVPQLPPPAVAPPLPRVSVGQRWHYETIDLYRNEKVGELFAEVLRADPPGSNTPPGVPIAHGADAPLVVG